MRRRSLLDMAPAPDALDRVTLLRGGAAGLAAYALGYLITYAWKAPAVGEALGGINAIAELAGGQAIPSWKAVGWLHLNAHLVATRVPALGGGSRLVNFIDASDDGSLVLLYGLVVVLLLLAGGVSARIGDLDRPASAAAAGATVAVGYLPAAVIGTLLVGHTLGGDLRIAPDLVTAVAVAGIVLPAFLGALGGAVGEWVQSGLGR